MQCSIKFNIKTKKWEASKRGKIPKESRELFNKLINHIDLFNGKIPPFMERKITHAEWVAIKEDTKTWNDCYLDIPNDIIKKMYYRKGCQYIQLSNDYGLYHLGNDICGFNVPEFIVEQQIRIRTKFIQEKMQKDSAIYL